ncbi:MAG: penicillin-binding protein, partial [Polaromonas sp.]
ARNAFIMDSLLQEVARSGTAARAQATLKRPDLFGKTGTTNDSIDTWFVGFQPTLTAAVWMGYDTPKKLGDRETGGGLSLPIWINFMEYALKGVPVTEYPPPEGVVNIGGEWYYNEHAKGAGVSSLGTQDPATANAGQAAPGGAIQVLPPSDEKKRILDLFKN